MRFHSLLVGFVAIALLPGCTSRAPSPARSDNSLGEVHAAVSCSAPAQREFDHALVLLHHMTYPQARASFRKVVSLDSTCAMGYWGVAMTLFQPMWPTRPGQADRELGWQMAQRADSLGSAQERDRLLIASAVAFFRDPASGDYWERIRRWESASERAYQAMPNEDEAAAFYALAHLAAAQASGAQRANHARAAGIVAEVLARNPRHPGAMHYLIHANDAVAREREATDVVHAYEHLAPDNPHALHMPTHIYVRLGDWPRAIEGNIKAAAAALAYPAGDQGQFVWDEFPHAIEYLVYAYLQRGADDSARVQRERLNATARLEPTFKTAFHLASSAARYALERDAWAEAAALMPRQPATLVWDRFPWPEGVTVFAHGLGAIKLGDKQGALASRARLGELESAAAATGESLFVRNVRVLRLVLSASIAQASGQSDSALALMRAAVELEERTPKHAVTPAPTLPARELLGDLLREQGRPREALEEYTRSLAAYPNRFRSVVAAARAAREAGDSARAASLYRQLELIADRLSRRESLNEAREYLSRASRK